MANPERSNMAEGSGQGPESPTLIIPPNKGQIRAGEYSLGTPGSSTPETQGLGTQVTNLTERLDRLTTLLERQGESEPRVERIQTPRSYFNQVLDSIRTLEQMPPFPDRDRNLQEAREMRNGLRREANEMGLLTSTKEVLFDIYYKARVEVTRDQKFGTGEYEGHGKLTELDSRIQVAKRWSSEAALPATERTSGRSSFWDSRQVRAIASRQGMTKEQLMERYGGVVDDFNEESLRLIKAAVEDRRRNLTEYEYEENDRSVRLVDNGLLDIDQDGASVWNFTWNSPHETVYVPRNFEDLRSVIENERKKRYSVPNRGDYESWIQFVADDLDEIDECLPYILDAIQTKFGGDPDKVYQTIDREKDKLQLAVENFGKKLGYERRQAEYWRFRRLKSRLTTEINLLGGQEFSKLVHEDWSPFLKYLGTLARSFQDVEHQDSLMDAMYLDNEGMMALALHKYEEKDGEFWRYGQNTADTPKHFKAKGEGKRWQARRRKEIENFLVTHELRPIQELLAYDSNHPDGVDPANAVFMKLKKKFDDLDIEDRTNGVVYTDEDGNPILNAQGQPLSRWEEYCQKAYEWERSGKQGDVRDDEQRVLFQHPLARALTDKQFEAMFREVPNMNERSVKNKLVVKRRQARSVMESAERMSRAFMQDSAAALARHNLSFEDLKKTGFIPDNIQLEANGDPVLNTNNELVDTAGNVIPYSVARIAVDRFGKPLRDEDGRLMPEAIAHNVLLRELVKKAIEEDENKPFREKRFKMTYVLRNAEGLGLERDLPVYDNWYLGAHDTIRPGLLSYIESFPELKALLEDKAKIRAINDDNDYGGDAKTVITRWVEDEREFVQLMEIYIRATYKDYYNFPGHDTEGAGVKEIRNLLLLPYGQSRGTVEINSLIHMAWLGETDFLSAYGCRNWKQLMGLLKGPDEVVFQQIGSLFETPRDAEYWVKRFASIIEQQKTAFSGGKDGGGTPHGAYNDGLAQAGFKWRTANQSAEYLVTKTNKLEGTDITPDEFLAIQDPDLAYSRLTEHTYEGLVKLAAEVAMPMMSIMEQRLKLENVYGRSPGTAKFYNTLLWYAVSNWMDTNWVEFRGKLGIGIDIDLHMARKFIRTVLYESRLIFDDQQWDERMLGYTLPASEWKAVSDWDRKKNPKDKPKEPGKIIRYRTKGGKTVGYGGKDNRGYPVYSDPPRIIEGETVAGLLDAFPDEIRRDIMGKGLFPYGLDSTYPETMRMIQIGSEVEGVETRNIYGGLIYETDASGDVILRNGQPTIDQNKMRRQTRKRKHVERVA